MNTPPILIEPTIAKPATKQPARRATNPLRELIAVGRMPVILELHLTEADRLAQVKLRQQHLARGYELPNLTILGQYLRQVDVEDPELATDERSLIAKLQTYADLVSSGGVDLIALDDGSRGRETLDNAVAAELLIGLGADPARLMINMVARNRQAEQIRRRLKHFADLGVRNVLLLTGDLPVDRNVRAVFPLDCIGMLELAREMLIRGELPDEFWPAAAGHPNPDADPDGLRTLHKALAGARVIVTQAIYSIEQFGDWMQALQKQGALDMVHVLAEVIPITSANQLRAIADVPGMRVPRELIEQLDAAQVRNEQASAAGGHPVDWVKQRARREGHRVTRELLHRIRKTPGVSGFYLGCVKGFEPHLELLKESPLLPEHADALHKITKISGAERQRALAELPGIEGVVRAARRRVARDRGWQVALGRRLAAAPWAERLFRLIEWPKVVVFGCKGCDQCDLSPDALVCPRGCAKQMSHGPCGAPRLVNGRVLCEDTSRECTWATIRVRREQYGVAVAARLASKTAPSAEFYEGRRFSASLPVLNGQKLGPNWSLAWRAPAARLMGLLRRGFRLSTQGSPRSLATLAEAQLERLVAIIRERPDAGDEELLVKVLSLIATPAAAYLIEARLAELGLPAEGAMTDLSLRERFLLAEALPVARRNVERQGDRDESRSASNVGQELLRVIPEGRQLRQAVRRELANGLIQHIHALGATVSYAPPLLDTKQVDDFLAALTILKDELQLAGSRRPVVAGGLFAHFHRIHYKHHYHAPIALQYAHDGVDRARGEARLVIDMRQYGTAPRFRSNLRETLERMAAGRRESDGALLLEDFKPFSQSVCWKFNAEFWARLREFEAATGVSYDASIGGSTDHNLAYARSAARAFYDKISRQALGGEPMYLLEIGVASTHRARAFLGEYRRLCELHGVDYADHTTYLLADFSPKLLEQAAEQVSRVHAKVATARIDAGDPFAALRQYQGRVAHAHLCNVYDNLPTDQWEWAHGAWSRVETRAYLSPTAAAEAAAKHGLGFDDQQALHGKLLELGAGGEQADCGLLDWLKQRMVDAGRGPAAYVPLWIDLFSAIRTDERVVDAGASTAAEPHVADDIRLLSALHPVSERFRVHSNHVALGGFRQLLSLLHPHGTLEVVDLFVQRLEEYTQSFKGPAKYDGSTINWLNGPLFRAVAEREGFQVRFQPFRPFDPKSPSVVLLATRKHASDARHG